MTPFFKKLFPIIFKYIEENLQQDTPVVHFETHDVLKSQLNLAIGEEGVSVDELLMFIENQYLKYSVRTGHRQFFNQLFGGFSSVGFLGDVVTSLTNTSMYTYEVAPVAALLEKEVLNKMLSLVGFKHGDGTFVTGGSNANYMALLCARNKTDPTIKKRGFANSALVLFVSDQAHYSFERAADLLGIGSNNLVKIKTDNNGQMMVDELNKEIVRHLEQGKKPFFVAATAGTTVLGAFDPIDEIAQLAKQYDMWFHIDGAFGASVLLSRQHKYLLDGSELADSLTWDAHKMMGATLMCSAFLIKEPNFLKQTCAVGGTEYLYHDEDECYDLGQISLQCGRRVDVLKLWLLWKHYGDRGYEACIDHVFELAKYANQQVAEHPNLELMTPTQSLNICFRYRPNSQTDINTFNLALREQLRRSGKTLVNYAIIKGNVVIRLVIVNFELSKTDIDTFFANVLSVAKTLS
jgi:glutamate/tyrosine decarboxylase-like PLP-dependent enzyme